MPGGRPPKYKTEEERRQARRAQERQRYAKNPESRRLKLARSKRYNRKRNVDEDKRCSVCEEPIYYLNKSGLCLRCGVKAYQRRRRNSLYDTEDGVTSADF